MADDDAKPPRSGPDANPAALPPFEPRGTTLAIPHETDDAGEALHEGAAELPFGARPRAHDAAHAEPSMLASVLRRLAYEPTQRHGLSQQLNQLIARGAVVGERFEVLESLGRGGMGHVLRALDRRLEREVAIKIMCFHRSAQAQRGQLLAMFDREARATARLNHPNIVQIYESGVWEHEPFLVLELLTGRSLADRLADGPLPREQALALAAQLVDAVAHAHEAGILHRDLKPRNVFLRDDGVLKVLDFGLAAVWEQLRGSHECGATDADLRLRGGTPGYMAPEQQRGELQDTRTDVWGLGLVIAEMIRGNRPSMSADGRPELTHPAIDAELRSILARATEPRAEARYPSARALGDDLTRLRRGEPVSVFAYTRRQLAGRWFRRRARALAGFGLVVGAVVAGFAVASLSSGGPPCELASDSLVGVWDASRRSAVRAAFMSADTPFAIREHQRFAAAVDDYLRRWAEANQASCRATKIESRQPEDLFERRAVCFGRLASSLEALTGELSQPLSAERLEHAVEAVQALPPVSLCADMQALASGRYQPSSTAERARHVAIAEAIAQTRASLALDERGLAAQRAAAALSLAEQHGTPALKAEASYLAGRTSRGDAALAPLQQSIEWASEAADDRLVAQAWQTLLWVTGVDMERWAQAEELIPFARSALLRAGDPADLRIAYEHLLGLLYTAQANHELAIEAHRRGVERAEASYGGSSRELAISLRDLAHARYRAGDLAGAELGHRRSLALRVELVGAGHPLVAKAWNSLALVAYQQGNYARAAERFRSAIAILEDVRGADSPIVATGLRNLASALEGQGDIEAAIQALQRALRIGERDRPNSLGVAATLTNLGLAYTAAEQFDRAIEAHERALAIRSDALGPQHGKVASCWDNLAAAYLAKGEVERAMRLHRRALDIRISAYGDDHPKVSLTRSDLGERLLAQGQLVEAERLLGRALADLEDRLGPEHGDLGWPLTALARLRLERGDHADARGLAERALAIRTAQGASAADRAETRFALGRAMWPNPRDRARSLALVKQAAEELASAGPAFRDRHRAVLGWLRDRR